MNDEQQVRYGGDAQQRLRSHADDETAQGTVAADLLQCCTVVDGAGHELGEIEDLMVDIRSGAVSHIVLSYGSWLHRKEAAVPWSALRADVASGCLILDRDIADFERGAGVDEAGERSPCFGSLR